MQRLTAPVLHKSFLCYQHGSTNDCHGLVFAPGAPGGYSSAWMLMEIVPFVGVRLCYTVYHGDLESMSDT